MVEMKPDMAVAQQLRKSIDVRRAEPLQIKYEPLAPLSC